MYDFVFIIVYLFMHDTRSYFSFFFTPCLESVTGKSQITCTCDALLLLTDIMASQLEMRAHPPVDQSAAQGRVERAKNTEQKTTWTAGY